MSPLRLLRAALPLLLLPLHAAYAQQAAPLEAADGATYVFETVDSYDLQGAPATEMWASSKGHVTVYGVLQGQHEPTAIRFRYVLAGSADADSAGRSFERCDRFTLVAMSKPGQYLLEVRQEGDEYSPHVGCRLTRR
jgi:hypothetical protein